MKIYNIQFEEDPYAKDARGISKFYHEVILLMKFLQIESQVKIMNIKNYDLFYSVYKKRDDKQIENNKYEDIENDYINYDDFSIPNH